MTRIIILAALAAAAPLSAETRQQIYDRAQAAYDKGDWAGAAAGFARVLAPAGKASLADGTIRIRYATALNELGRPEEAIEQARRATAEFPAGQGAERADALTTFGKILHGQYRLAEAADAYEAAREAAPATAPAWMDAARAAVQASAVYDPPRALRAADVALADPAYAAAPKEAQAQLLSLKARAQLNGGDAKAAKATIGKALAMTGVPGGSPKVNLLQAIVRGDAALIYARSGNQDEAKRYLAFSGGGYLPSTNWWGDGNRQPPVCDDVVKPDDVAVVAFMIDEAGRPIGADTVYASRPGAMGVAFAQAVRGWDPSPAAAKLSAFWRYSLRIEMRCVTRPAPIAIADSFARTSLDWWLSHGATRPDKTDGRSIPALHHPMFERLAPLLKERSNGSILRADDLLVDAGAPPEVRAVVMRPFATTRADRIAGDPLPGWFAPFLKRLETTPDGGRAAAWLRLEEAMALGDARRLDSAKPLLEAVLATPERQLPADDAIRMLATLRLAATDQRQGASEAAAQRLRRAGLDAEQCSTLDVRPLPVNRSVADSIFPKEAMRWGFDGYVKEAYDIGADGRVTDVRTVIAYPAFVFGEASTRAVSSFRYQPPTLDGKVLGCSSQMTAFRFVTPR